MERRAIGEMGKSPFAGHGIEKEGGEKNGVDDLFEELARVHVDWTTAATQGGWGRRVARRNEEVRRPVERASWVGVQPS